MPLDQETIAEQQALLATHRRTLAHLLQQAAQYGGEVFAPPQTASGIAAARTDIQRIKVALREGGVPVEDQPDDEAHPAASQLGPQRAAGPPIKQRLQTAIGLLLLTVLIGVLTNIATGNAWGEYTSLAWALLVLCVGGAIVLTVRQVHLERESSISAAVAETNRSRMLARVEASWVKGVLEQSIYQIARIELGLEYDPKAVAHPWESIVQRPNQPIQVLPVGKAVIEVFDELGQEVLILGAPGAGKTTLLLELTRDLIARARQHAQHPIPVVFNLSTWATKRLSLDKWLVEELDKQYDVPRTLAQEWVTANTILPLLDGLDEVAAAQRDACAEAINVYRRECGFVPLVVCSRVEEYAALTGKLRLTGAVVIQPLMAEQLATYLKPKAFAGVRALLRDDPTLGELLNTPLMLSIMVLTYKEKSPAKLRASGTLEERRRRLFDDYIEAMFERRSEEMRYPRVHTIHWLAWLARALSRQAQTVFLIERLQPDWLPTRAARWRYTLVDRLAVGLGAGLSVGLVSGVASALGAGLTNPLLSALGNGLSVGLAAGLFGGERETPSSPRRGIGQLVRSAILGFLVVGLAVGLLHGLFLGLGGEPMRSGVASPFPLPLGRGPLDVLIIALAGVSDSGPLGALIGVLAGRPGVQPRRVSVVETLRWSWPKARRSALGGLAGGLAIGLFAGLGSGLFVGLGGGQAVGVSGGLAVGVFGGLFVGLGFGLLYGLVFGLAVGVGGGLTGGEVEATAIPNQGIRRSARSAILSGLVVGIIFGLTTELLWGPIYGLVAESASALVDGLKFGLIGALAYGGYACLSHLALRLVLWRSGAMPWRYARFLDYCAGRIFLRKVGGGYIFVHRLLLEYFAALEPVQPTPAPDAGARLPLPTPSMTNNDDVAIRIYDADMRVLPTPETALNHSLSASDRNLPTFIPRATSPTAYTDAPALHPNLILGSFHLLFWLIFHPAAWRNHVARIDPTLRPGFCLLELRRAQWRDPALRRLLLQGYVVVPVLVGLLVGLVVRVPRGVSVEGIVGTLTVSLPLGLAVGLVFGLVCGVAGGLTGGPAAALMVFPTVLLLDASGLRGAGLVAMAVAVFVAGGVASGVASGVERQGRDYSVARQSRSVIIGVLISAVVAGVGFSAGFGVVVVAAYYAAAGRVDAAINMLTNVAPLVVGLVAGVAFGVEHGLALGLAGGLGTGSWRRGVAFGIAVSIAVGMAVGVGINPNESSGVAFIVFFSASFGALFALPFVIADRMAGAWAGALAGALGGGGAWLAQVVLLMNAPFWPTVPLSLAGFLLGVTLPLWRPILLYPFLAAYNLVLYHADQRRALDRPALLRYHSAFWDEHQRLPLLGLDDHVVLVAERNADEGRAAIEYLTSSRQRWAARAAQIELDAGRLERDADAEAIGQAHRSLAAGELEGPASALLRSFSRISQDVDAALRQESAYNQRLALSAVEDRLDGLLRELTRSSERYDVRFRPVAIEWHRIVADKVRALAAAEARDRG